MQKEIYHLEVAPEGKIYFVSDLHLFCFPDEKSEEREKNMIAFLDSITSSAKAIFFLGDMFDFWIEYKYIMPKGNVRLQAKWLELKEKNIDLYYFTGNHDMWVSDYFHTYFGFKIFKKHQKFIFDKTTNILIGHGDGLGPSDIKYKLFKFIVSSLLIAVVGRLLPPNLLFAVGVYCSKKSRTNFNKQGKYENFLGEDKEHLIVFCKKYLEKTDATIDYFLFGHRHIPIEFSLQSGKSTYINVGDWINNHTYAIYESGKFHLKKFIPQDKK